MSYSFILSANDIKLSAKDIKESFAALSELILDEIITEQERNKLCGNFKCTY